MECVLRKFGSYENFEEVTGGSILPKSQVWAAVRKYLQKEGCVGEVSAMRYLQHVQRQITYKQLKYHLVRNSPALKKMQVTMMCRSG